MQSVEKIYKKNIESNKEKAHDLKLNMNLISIFRLVTVILCISIDYILYRNNNINIALIVTLFFIIIFMLLVLLHDILFNQKKRFEILIKINEDGLNRINGNLNAIDDGGEEYLDENNPFTNDLDIFGKNSLFKIINTCATDGGRRELSDVLKNSNSFKMDEILKRQEAIKELSLKVDWRHKIIVEGRLKNNKKSDIDKFIEWSKDSIEIKNGSILIASIFIMFTLLSILGVINGVLPESFILLDLMINYVVLKLMSKNLKDQINIFESVKNTMISYSKILELIQKEKFESSYLRELQENLILNKSNNDGGSGETIDCKASMKKLATIFSWIGDSGYNAYYFIINITLFSDIFLLYFETFVI